jgi:hypothetical protein
MRNRRATSGKSNNNFFIPTSRSILLIPFRAALNQTVISLPFKDKIRVSKDCGGIFKKSLRPAFSHARGYNAQTITLLESGVNPHG